MMKLVKCICYNCESSLADLYDCENGFKLVKCRGCGLLYVSPRPGDQEILNSAESGRFMVSSEEKSLGVRYNPRRIRRYQKILKDFFEKNSLSRSGLRWLDVGCGFGEFIEALSAYSNNNLLVQGVDPNIERIKSAKARGLNVAIDWSKDIEGQYDFISLLNVYSHLSDPIEFISGLRKILKPGGEMLLETGHTSHLPKSLQARPYYLPDHLSFANREIVEDILKRTGFEVMDIKFYRPSVWPRLCEFKAVARRVAGVISGREPFRNLILRSPGADMYIRCRLIG